MLREPSVCQLLSRTGNLCRASLTLGTQRAPWDGALVSRAWPALTPCPSCPMHLVMWITHAQATRNGIVLEDLALHADSS